MHNINKQTTKTSGVVWLVRRHNNVRLGPAISAPHLKVDSHRDSSILMLGAGFVTLPTLYILSDAGVSVTVGM
jgi:hypothetical protein